jgi:hypothetical protein
VCLATLLVFAFTRPGRSRRRSAGHRHRPASPGANRERRGVLNPTSVYSPGGLIDVPRDARPPGSADKPRFDGAQENARPARPQGAREAFRPPRPAAGPMGPPPRPGYAAPGYQAPGYQAPEYQAGARQAPGPGVGRGPSPGQPGRPPQPPMSSPGRTRAAEAPPPRDPSVPRSAPPPGDPSASRGAPPSGEARGARPRAPFREGPPPRPGAAPGPGNPPRGAAAPREPWRPDAQVPPPFDAVHPPHATRPGRPSAESPRGTGRPSAAPGHGPSAGWRPPAGSPRPGTPRPAAPGTSRPGAPGAWAGPPPTAPGAPFDGGYAQVIRPADGPGGVGRDRQSPSRPSNRGEEVYVYRDASEPAAASSPRRPAGDDAAYWYDLLAEDPAPQDEQARGPFEPLLPSSTPAADMPPDMARGDRSEAPEQTRARKLEQLRDLYLTAEAIGEQNVDKHFDQLLAQQRELISDYFRQPATAEPGVAHPGDGQPTQTSDPGAPSGPPGAPEGAGARAKPPRAW